MLLTGDHHLKGRHPMEHDIQIHHKEEKAMVVVVGSSGLKRWNYLGKCQDNCSTQNLQALCRDNLLEVAVHCHS